MCAKNGKTARARICQRVKKFLKYQAPLLLCVSVFFICPKAHAKIVINEIMTSDKNSSKNEFIELYNTGNEEVSLNGFKLTKKTAGGNESNLVSSLKFLGKISASGYFVVAHPSFAEGIGADLAYSGSSYSIADDNSVILYDSFGGIVDLVGYGAASSFETSAPKNPSEGKSIGRIGGNDSGDNSKDFFTLEETSPGSENEAAEEEAEENGEAESESDINELEIYIKIKHDKKTYPKIYDYFEAEISDVVGDNLEFDRIGKKYEYSCKISGKKCAYEKLKFTWNFGDKHRSYLFSTKHKYEKEGVYLASLKVYDPLGKKKTVKSFVVGVGEVPHPEVKIVAVNPNPGGRDTEKETIVIQNKSKKRINLKGWSIATGWKKMYNHPIAKDFRIKPGKKREITREFSKFSLNNKKTKIELRYPDGNIAHSLKYKKKNGIAEDEIYKKEKGGWKWNKPVKKIEQNASGLNIDADVQSAIFNQQNKIKENEVTDKWNENAVKQTIEKKEILLLKYEPPSKLVDIGFEPYVFGMENLRRTENAYYFTPEYQGNGHYAIFFLKKVFSVFNKWTNIFLNNFLI